MDGSQCPQNESDVPMVVEGTPWVEWLCVVSRPVAFEEGAGEALFPYPFHWCLTVECPTCSVLTRQDPPGRWLSAGWERLNFTPTVLFLHAVEFCDWRGGIYVLQV